MSSFPFSNSSSWTGLLLLKMISFCVIFFVKLHFSRPGKSRVSNLFFTSIKISIAIDWNIFLVYKVWIFVWLSEYVYFYRNTESFEIISKNIKITSLASVNVMKLKSSVFLHKPWTELCFIEIESTELSKNPSQLAHIYFIYVNENWITSERFSIFIPTA